MYFSDKVIVHQQRGFEPINKINVSIIPTNCNLKGEEKTTSLQIKYKGSLQNK